MSAIAQPHLAQFSEIERQGDNAPFNIARPQ
jgi:hypothetical protein